MNLLPIIGYSLVALVGFVVLAGVWITWALSTMPEDNEE